MPGPVSDSFDSEWGTSSARHEIADALEEMYETLSTHLGEQPPRFILELVRDEKEEEKTSLELSEKQWRLLRFALERARDNL